MTLEAYRTFRERVNRYRRNRRLADAAYRERMNAYHRAYYAAHPELKTYKRDWKRRADERKYQARHGRQLAGLHEPSCPGPTVGCTCVEVILGTVPG